MRRRAIRSVTHSNPARAADVYATLKKHGGSSKLGREFATDVYRLARVDKAPRVRRGRNRHDRKRDRRTAAEFFRLQDAGLLRAAEDLPDARKFPRAGSFAHVDVLAVRRNPRKRKGRTMARSAAQKRAFRKMLAGLRKFRGGKRRRRRTVAARKPRKAHRRAHARRRRARVVLVRTNPKHRRKHMARRHRRRRGRVTAIMVNPRRRKRFRMRRHRRRNPSGFVGQLLSLGVPAILTSGALALADTKLMSTLSPMARGGIKLVAAVGAGVLLRKRPELSRVVVASIVSSLVYEQVMRLSGGVAAPSTVQAAQQLKALVLEDPIAGRQAMGVLVEGPRGMGARLDENVSLSGALDTPSGALPPNGHYANVHLG